MVGGNTAVCFEVQVLRITRRLQMSRPRADRRPYAPVYCSHSLMNTVDIQVYRFGKGSNFSKFHKSDLQETNCKLEPARAYILLCS